MIDRIRLFVLLARPSVLVIFGLFALTGLAEAGQGDDTARLAVVLAVVISFVIFSVAVNDLADRAIDAVNLPDDPARPLVTGSGRDDEFVILAVVSASISLAFSALLHWPAVVVVALGLLLSLSYSIRPIRVADRGALASMLLPAGYVGVPYLVGIFAARAHVTRADLLLGAGLYLGFIGRILLKDFRDVRGDTLFGKRTFLVRHGRGATCGFSAVCWVAGSVTLAAVRQPTPSLVAAYIAFVAVALILLRALSEDRGARRDEWLISAIAVVGRGLILTVVAHLGMTDAHWAPLPAGAVTMVLTAVTIGQAWIMATHGPKVRAMPVELPAIATSEPEPVPAHR